MQKLRVTNQTVHDFTASCHTFLTELLALNMELTNEEIIESFTGLTQELASRSNEAFDKMREDPEFQQESVAFSNAIEEIPLDEDSEAAGV